MQTASFLLLSLFVYYIALLNLSKLNFTKRDIVLAIAITEAVALFIFSISKAEFLVNFSIIVVMIICSWKKSRSLPSSIVYSILASLIAILANNIAGLPIMYLFGFFSEDIRNSWLLTFAVLGICLPVAFFISKYIGDLFYNKTKMFSDELKSKLSIYIIFGATITLVLFYLNNFFSDLIIHRTLLDTIYTALLVIYFIYLVFAIYAFTTNAKNEMEIKHKEELFENLHNYTDNLENLYNEMRRFRHDHINMLTPLYAYLDNNDVEGTKTYLQNYILPISDKIHISNSTIDRLKNINIPELKGILAVKLLYAQEHDIHVYVEVSESFDSINIDLVDLCRVTGILLDNAIEHCRTIHPSNLRFAAIKNNSDILFVFSNTITAPPPISKMFEKDFSTKGNNRGLGLYSLQNILGNHPNVSLETFILDNEFTQKLIVTN